MWKRGRHQPDLPDQRQWPQALREADADLQHAVVRGEPPEVLAALRARRDGLAAKHGWTIPEAGGAPGRNGFDRAAGDDVRTGQQGDDR